MQKPAFKEIIEGKTDKKIDISVHVQTNPGAKGVNNTAFYFKTKVNYHFIVVNNATEGLGVKTIAAKDVKTLTYLDYLSFDPEPLDKCPDTLEDLLSIPVKTRK